MHFTKEDEQLKQGRIQPHIREMLSGNVVEAIKPSNHLVNPRFREIYNLNKPSDSQEFKQNQHLSKGSATNHCLIWVAVWYFFTKPIPSFITEDVLKAIRHNIFSQF